MYRLPVFYVRYSQTHTSAIAADYGQRPAGALLCAQAAGGALKGRGQIVVVAHIPARTLANADQAAHAGLFTETHHAVIRFCERHNGAHLHTNAALVTDRYGIAAPTVSFDPDGALFSVFRLVKGLRAYGFASTTACTLPGFGYQLFQLKAPLFPDASAIVDT